MDTIKVLCDWFENIRSVKHSSGREETGIFEFRSILGHYFGLDWMNHWGIDSSLFRFGQYIIFLDNIWAWT